MEADVYLRCARATDAPALARLRAASALELGWIAVPDVADFEARACRAFARLLRDDRMSG
jgi:hypothetical protein